MQTVIDESISHLKKSEKQSCILIANSIEEQGIKVKLTPARNCQVAIAKIDDCIIRGSDVKKCDYAFLYEVQTSCSFVIMVELKGRDYERALLQLQNTYENTEFQSFLASLPKPRKVRAVVVIGPKAQINKPKLEKLESIVGVRTLPKKMDKGQTFDLIEFVKLWQ